MNSSVASFVLPLFLIPTALGQSKPQGPGLSGRQTRTPVKRKVSPSPTPNSTTQGGIVRICQGIAIPKGYTIVAYESSLSCPHGAYVLKRDDSESRFSDAAESTAPQTTSPTNMTENTAPQTTSPTSTIESTAPQTTSPTNTTESTVPQTTSPTNTTASASRPRRISNEQLNSVAPTLVGANNAPSNVRPPVLSGMPSSTPVSASTSVRPAINLGEAKDEEVDEGDVVRIDTSLVTVPVSVLDRQGRYVPGLRKEDFRVLENGMEQRIAYFEPTEKPFTVALVLDMSASTHFHLWEIKAAAIAFAKQLRPQDRVLVVTFNDEVLLLTEATNDLNVVNEVIEQNANTGDSTRLYDAVSLVINERLNKIPGRKAIVLFTDGVDTASYQATYQSTLREVEELDALIYPIQYDTTDYMRAMQGAGNITVTTTTSGNWPFPSSSSTRVIQGSPSTGTQLPGTTKADYTKAEQYLHQLADKTGARLYQANDPKQLADAFSRIAEELRRQYSLGYYPPTRVQSGERREIKVRVNRPDLGVRARTSYMQRDLTAPR
jgi:Ca-activated chloride channel family protein